jgi:hypothetical protein
MSTERERLMICQDSCEQSARERDTLQETLNRLRDTLAEQTQACRSYLSTPPQRTPLTKVSARTGVYPPCSAQNHPQELQAFAYKIETSTRERDEAMLTSVQP